MRFILVALAALLWSGVALAQFPTVAFTHTAVTVTNASGEALATNASRAWVLLENDSDSAIYCKVGATAVANEGVRLNANGGAWELSPRLGNHTTAAINCIVASGSKTLLVTEGQ